MDDFYTQLLKIEREIAKSKKVFVFFDKDLDGSCSYIQLKLGFPSIICGGFPVGKDKTSQQKALKNVCEDCDCVVFLDMPVICDDVLEKLNDKCLIWIDHHIENSKKNIEKFSVLHFNPSFFPNCESFAVSFWIYEIMRLRGKENSFWGALGSLGDFSLTSCVKDLLVECREDFNILFDGISRELVESVLLCLESPSQKSAVVIRKLWYETYFIKFKMFFDLLYKFEKLEDAFCIVEEILSYTPKKLSSELLFGMREHFVKFREVLEEIKSHIIIAQKVWDRSVLWYEYSDTSFSFNRQLSEELQYRIPNCCVIVCAFWKKTKNIWTCSFRSQGKYDVNEIVVKSLQGLQGNGGGHKYAAGVSVCEKDFEKFKEKALNLIYTAS